MSVGRNILWSASEQTLRIVVAFFVNVFVARTLGPADFGIIASAMALAGLFGSIALLGLDLVTIREMSANHADAGETFLTTLSLRLAASLAILAGVCCWSLPGFFGPEADAFGKVTLIVCLLIPFQAIGCTIGNSFVVSLQSKLSACAISVALLAATALRIRGIHEKAAVDFFAWCYLFEFGFATVLIYALFHRYARNRFGPYRFSWTRAKELLGRAKWLLMSSVVVSILTNVGLLLIATYGSKVEIGNYAAAARLVSSFQFLPGLIGQAFVPMIGKLYDLSDVNLEAYEEQLFRLLWLVGYSVAIFFLLFGPSVISFLLGKDFLGAAPIVRVLALSVIPISLGAARAAIFAKTRNYRSILISDVSGALVTTLLSALLIPHFGAIAVAGAATIGALVAYMLVPVLLAGIDAPSSRMMLRSAIRPFPNFRTLFSGKSVAGRLNVQSC